MLIGDDVDVYDNVIWDYVDVDVYDNVDMRWCWCFMIMLYEMMLMLIMSLRRDDVDDDIEMGWCWCWWWHCDGCLLCMYMMGVVTKLDILSGGNRVVKKCWASLVGNDLESLIIHGQCTNGSHVS